MKPERAAVMAEPDQEMVDAPAVMRDVRRSLLGRATKAKSTGPSLDLSEVVVEEDEMVDLELVPLAENEASSL